MQKKRYSGLYDYEKKRGLKFDPKDPNSISRTQEQFAEEADINFIVNKYTKTGVLEILPGEPLYGDFTTGISFEESQNRIAQAKAMFEGLPATIRARFDNNVAKLIDFVTDPKNREEAIKIGVYPKPPIDKYDETGKKLPPETKTGGAPAGAAQSAGTAEKKPENG